MLAKNPNYPKSIKIHSPVLKDFDGFRKECEWHNYLTWGFTVCTVQVLSKFKECVVLSHSDGIFSDSGQPLVGMPLGLGLMRGRGKRYFIVPYFIAPSESKGFGVVSVI